MFFLLGEDPSIFVTLLASFHSGLVNDTDISDDSHRFSMRNGVSSSTVNAPAILLLAEGHFW